MAEAEVDTRSKGDMPVGPALKIKPVRSFICCGVHICGSYHGDYPLTLFQADAIELHVSTYKTRFRELYRRDES